MTWEEIEPNRYNLIDAKSGTVATIEPLPWDANTLGLVVENAERNIKNARLYKNLTQAKAQGLAMVKEIRNGNSSN